MKRLRTIALCLALGLASACSDDDPSSPEADAGFLDMGQPDSSVDQGPTDLGQDDGSSFADNPFMQDGFLNIAHRGGSLLAPEETLVAFENAKMVGADVIECDVHATSDGVVVCMHDDNVNRTTDGTGFVRAMTFEELRALDAGYQFTTDGGATYPYRGQGVVTATLDEVFEAHPTGPIALEIKQAQPSIADEVVRIVQSHNATDRVVIASFGDATIQEVRAADPTILTGMAVGEMLAFNRLKDEDEATYVPPTLVIEAPTTATTQDKVDRAHRLGIRFFVWTVNERAEMEQMLDLGVDGIFTDDPALLAEVVQSRE